MAEDEVEVTTGFYDYGADFPLFIYFGCFYFKCEFDRKRERSIVSRSVCCYAVSLLISVNGAMK